MDENRLLSWTKTRDLLARAGLAVIGEEITDWNSLEEAAARYRYPLILKGYATAVAHKSEHGLVRPGIRNTRQLEKQFNDLSRQLATLPEISQIIIQPVLDRGVELVLGARRDSTFGPTVMVGLGGTMVEIFDDVVFGLAPLEPQTAFSMIDRLRFRKMLEGYRDLPPVNKEELAKMLVKLGNILADYPQVQEIDLNPVIGTPEGLAIVDLRATIK